MSIPDTKLLVMLRAACVITLFLSTAASARTLESDEDFSSGNYTGGSGWTGNWTESGDDGVSGTGDIAISGGQLRFIGDGGGNGFVFRELDLSALSSSSGVLLFFDISFDGTLETTDIFEVYARDAGGSGWTEIRQFNGQVP